MTNPYVRQLLHYMEERYAVDTEAMSLSAWICANTTLRKRPYSFDGYEFQREIADDLHHNLTVIKLSQVGLALALDTPLPTPTGWTTMGEVSVGDVLFDEQGQPCTVEYASPVYLDRECFQVVFDDKSSIVADANHRWYVESPKAFNEDGFRGEIGRPDANDVRSTSGVVTTDFLRRLYRHVTFSVPNTAPLATNEVELPIDPFYLGAWLGDGNLYASVLTAHADDAPPMMAELTARGMVCTISSRKGDTIQFRVDLPRDRLICPRGHDKRVEGVTGPYDRCVRCLEQDKRYRAKGEPREVSIPYDTIPRRLTLLGLLGKRKFVPDIYLRAPEKARRDLLRGLLDTDGSITKRGRCSFYNTSPELSSAVAELAASLGLKPRTRWREPSPGVTRSGHRIESKLPIAEVSFVGYAEDGLFSLPRKAERLGRREDGKPSQACRRQVKAVRPVPSVPVRCVSVSSPSHLFLAGRAMVPTHNTEVQIRKALAICRRTAGVNVAFTLPDEQMFKRLSQTRLMPMVEGDKVFNPPTDGKPVRSMSTIQIADSWLFVMHCVEANATSQPLDYLFNDELDLSAQEIVGLFQSRLQNSDHRVTQRFSTPTFTDFGIDLEYKRSDQREYQVRCGCGEWQVPLFEEPWVRIPGLPNLEKLEHIDEAVAERLDLEAAEVVCRRCSRPLDLADAANREWVVKLPTRSHLGHGYRVRPFTSARLGVPYVVGQLLFQKRRNNVRRWYNTVLGEAYVSGSNRLGEGELRAIMRGEGVPEVGAEVPVGIGIDMGDVCHLALGTVADGKVDVFLWKQVPRHDIHDEVARLRERYTIVRGAVDRFPLMNDADRLRDESGGIIVPLQYRGETKVVLVEDEEERKSHISVNRTKHVDEWVGAIRTGRVTWRGYGAHAQVVIDHHRDMVRDEQPEKKPEWVKLTGDDHYFHAGAFLNFALRLTHLMDVISDDDVRTTVDFTYAPMVQADGGLFVLQRPGRSRVRSGRPLLGGLG